MTRNACFPFYFAIDRVISMKSFLLSSHCDLASLALKFNESSNLSSNHQSSTEEKTNGFRLELCVLDEYPSGSRPGMRPNFAVCVF